MPDPSPLAALFPLKIENLCLSIKGQVLIDHLSLELSANCLTIVMGANGAGKSLLLKILHGLVKPTSGTISWHGTAQFTAQSTPLSLAVRQRQAMIFQRPVLLRRSVAANMDFVLKLRSGQSVAKSVYQRDKLLDEVGLTAMAGKPARLLSGGEQQRLALARALATEPEVLFLDEPTASLDPGSVLRLESIVRKCSKLGTKVIFVTHDTGQARRLADDVVFLHAGTLQEHTLAAVFFDQPKSAAARAYLNGQLFI